MVPTHKGVGWGWMLYVYCNGISQYVIPISFSMDLNAVSGTVFDFSKLGGGGDTPSMVYRLFKPLNYNSIDFIQETQLENRLGNLMSCLGIQLQCYGGRWVMVGLLLLTPPVNGSE